jgi:hypothetical protein
MEMQRESGRAKAVMAEEFRRLVNGPSFRGSSVGWRQTWHVRPWLSCDYYWRLMMRISGEVMCFRHAFNRYGDGVRCRSSWMPRCVNAREFRLLDAWRSGRISRHASNESPLTKQISGHHLALFVLEETLMRHRHFCLRAIPEHFYHT